VKLRSTNSFLLILGALLAAGCGTATSAPQPAGPTAASSVSGGQPPGLASQRAAADARAILGKFVPPPGAVRLAKRPPLPGGSPTAGLITTAQADATGYWRASGTATGLLAWEKAHISGSFSRQDVIIGPPSWNTVYSLPAVPGVLPTREMNVQFYDAGGGMTVIMAEAMVSWQPPRPAAEVVPASVTEVTIAPSGPGPAPAPAPVTVSSAVVVRRLAALVNGLPLSTVAQDVPCPDGHGFTLTFRVTAGGAPAAVADGPGACGQVTLTLNGKSEPPLLPLDASTYRATVLKLAGLHSPS
jgi:hypothetical protein